MQNNEDTYRLAARQCASMVGWSLAVGLQDDHSTTDYLPGDLHLMSPTRLYETLRDTLPHTAGPDTGMPADVTLWQLDRDGFEPWHRPNRYDQLALPQLPRLRLAFERIKHLPGTLID